MLSEIDFASYLVYPTKATTPKAREAKRYALALKHDQPHPHRPKEPMIEAFVHKLASDLATTPIGDILGAHATLVPMPGHAPLLTGGLWAARRLAEALVAAGLGADVLAALERTEAIPSSSGSSMGNRPSLEVQYRSMRAHATLFKATQLTLVDDTVTRGRTALAAARRLEEVFPGVRICLFAAARTLGFVSEIESMIEPVRGRLVEQDGNVDRDPKF